MLKILLYLYNIIKMDSHNTIVYNADGYINYAWINNNLLDNDLLDNNLLDNNLLDNLSKSNNPNKLTELTKLTKLTKLNDPTKIIIKKTNTSHRTQIYYNHFC